MTTASVPVVAGVSSCAHRPDSGAGVTTLVMMERALTGALADVEARGTVAAADVARAIGLVVTPRGTWPDADPGRAALRRCGGSAAVRSIVTEVGVLQQTAVHIACAAVAGGEVRAALVLGGEAKWSADRLGAAPDPVASETSPDSVVSPVGDILHRLEIERGLVVPAVQYALIESALARRSGRSDAEHAREVAQLWADGSLAVLGRNDAWRPSPFDVAGLLSGDGGNRMIAAPYRRSMVSGWSVDQSVALIVTTAATALQWGIAESDVVGLVGSATSDHMVPLVARADLTGCPAFSVGAAAIEAATGRRVADAEVADLYSCFPSAVQVAAAELGRTGLSWTATGGMAAFGGPFNSYALHGVAAVVAALRNGAGATAVTTCVSGILTKGSVALWQRGPGPAVLCDVSEGDRAARTVVEVVDDLGSDARVVASTLVPADGGGRVFEILEDGAGRRTVASSLTPV